MSTRVQEKLFIMGRFPKVNISIGLLTDIYSRRVQEIEEGEAHR